MRGEDEKQDAMFSYVAPGKRVPADYPLRPIRAMVDLVLKEMSPRFARLYAQVGRPSIPAIGREKEKLAKDLGAHIYIDTAANDAAAILQAMGTTRAIFATAPSGDGMGLLVSGLAARGKLIVAGVPSDPIRFSAFPLVFGGRSVYGSLTGQAIMGLQ